MLRRVRAFGVDDATFIVAAQEDLAAVVADPETWAHWWPDLVALSTEDRGLKGARWTVGGAVSGRMEIWLEPFGDGVILHYLLWVDGVGRRQERALQGRVRRWKRQVHRLKDELEAGREPGRPRQPPVKEIAPGAE